jgi:hypothetical protein
MSKGCLAFKGLVKKTKKFFYDNSFYCVQEEKEEDGGGEVWGDVRAIYKDISFYG